MEPKIKNKRQLERIAYHEAGHAVVMHHFKGEIGEVSIKPNVNSLGGVKPKKKDTKNLLGINPYEIVAESKEYVMESLGGLAAEHIYNGEPNKVRSAGSTQDLKNAEGLCRDFNMEVSCQDLIDWLFNDTLKILKEKWEAVEALSAALIQKGAVSGGEARQIIVKCKRE